MSTPLKFTTPPRVVGKFMEPGIIAAAIPPMVDSAQPEKEAATSPNVVRPPDEDLAGRTELLFVSAREAWERRAQIGQ